MQTKIIKVKIMTTIMSAQTMSNSAVVPAIMIKPQQRKLIITTADEFKGTRGEPSHPLSVQVVI